MYLKKPVYNHEASDICKSLGISKESEFLGKEKLIFASINHLVQLRALYGKDNPEDDDFSKAPAMLRTVSGAIEASMALVSNEEEYTIVSLYGLAFASMARGVYSEYVEKKAREARKKKNGGKDKKEVGDILLELLKKVREEKGEMFGEKEKEDSNSLLDENGDWDYNHRTVNIRIGFIEKSAGNFEHYINMLDPKYGTPIKPVDDIINGALKKEDESSF